MSFPIYVASKGRPDSKLLAHLAQQVERKWRVFVEPQDRAAYEHRLPPRNVAMLSANDQGLPFVRRAILGFARNCTLRSDLSPEVASEWFWLIDDDVTSWYIAEDGKCHPLSMETVLAVAEQRTLKLSEDVAVAQVALEYRQFAWNAAHGAVAVNSYADVVVGIHRGRSRAAGFRGETDLKCDRDFSLQLIAAGRQVVRFRDLAFAAPKNGSNAGGLQEAYAEHGREAASSAAMARLWPGICSPYTKKDGRPDVRIDWRRAAQP